LVLNDTCTSHWHTQHTMSILLLFGILNACLGTFFTALGYCLQKIAHLNKPDEVSILKMPLYRYGLLSLIAGGVSSVGNLALLEQSIAAPFAALTLMYNAALAWKILGERFTSIDALSTITILAGVALAMIGATQNSQHEEFYTQDELWKLWSRNALPLIFTVAVLTGFSMWNIYVERGRQETNSATLCYSASAGIMGGFGALLIKSTIDIIKNGWRYDQVLSYLCPIFIPVCVLLQLRFMNQGLAYFGTLKFVPMYQSFLILANLLCGFIYFDDSAQYTSGAIWMFCTGCLITLMGVTVLIFKVEENDRPHSQGASSDFFEVAVDGYHVVIDSFRLEETEWLADEDDVQVLIDSKQCQGSIIKLFRNAASTIYYSYSISLCDLHHRMVDEFGLEVTLKDLIQDAVRRHVKLYILYNPISDHWTSSLETLRQELPPEVYIHVSTNDIGPNFFSKYVFNSKYAFHHQNYICVDGDQPDIARMMVTGCDVNSERSGWLVRNEIGYYWHELGVVFNCSKELHNFITTNHFDKIRRMCGSELTVAPFPLVNGGVTEENLMIELIITAEKSIQLENHMFISGDSRQKNRIAMALVDRVCVGIQTDDKFHAVVLSNGTYEDEPNYFRRKLCTISMECTLVNIEYLAKERGLSREELYSRLFIGRLEHNGVQVKIHSNIIIQDGMRAIRTSSNLTDRSLSHFSCDIELGVMLRGQMVKSLQYNLLQMYVGMEKNDYSIEQIVDQMQVQSHFGNIYPIHSKKLPHRLWAKFVMSFS